MNSSASPPGGPAATGISIAVCCHNSAARLAPTLGHLADQRGIPGFPWEVLVIDNASTDRTADIARETWPPAAAAPLRVIPEPRPGLQFARARAFDSARYPVVSFIDDDNWVDPDWIRLVWEILSARADVGACGGRSEAECEVPPPGWFPSWAHCYAVGPQGPPNEEPAGERPQLWGAGLSIRRSAWTGLVAGGFRPLLQDRQGQRLLSSGDDELSLALRLAGWRLWYDSRLRLKHFLPAPRLAWSYLRRLHRGFGLSLTDAYWFALGEGIGRCPDYRKSWFWVCLRQLWYVARILPTVLELRNPAAGEGDGRILEAEERVGRLQALWSARWDYRRHRRWVATAPWRGSRSRGEPVPPR